MVTVENGEIWAAETGAGGQGLPVVLLHPGVGDSRLWDPVLPHLTHLPRLIRYDARGYGNSPKPATGYSQRADLRAILDHFGVERAVLVGSSMGGRTAIGMALDEPGRVAGLGLLVPGVSGYPDVEVREVTEQIETLAKAGDMDGLVALALRLWGAAGTPPDPEATAALRAAIPAWFTTYGHEAEEPPLFDRLGELDLPCALLLGERDQPEVVRCNEEMAARIPGCELLRHPDSDHFPTLRAPRAVAELVTSLYARAAKAPA